MFRLTVMFSAQLSQDSKLIDLICKCVRMCELGKYSLS